jgi:undecaprenyl-diphosphatase
LGLIGAFVLVDRFRLGRAGGLALMLGLALVCGLLMAWAEVALGAHYPTDTIGGFATALAVIPATAFAVDRVWARR